MQHRYRVWSHLNQLEIAKGCQPATAGCERQQ
jgi:hypothetical protein